MVSNLYRNALADLLNPAPTHDLPPGLNALARLQGRLPPASEFPIRLTALQILQGDDLNNRGPADRSKISLRQAWEIRYWTKALGLTEAQLRVAVARVGHGAAAVRAYLRKE